MKKKFYVVLFVAWVIFLIQLPSIVKNIAVNKLEETIGRKVSSGNFRYNYLRNILSIENLKIYEKNGKDIFIKFDSFDVNIDILPLLKRKIYIENLNLINPTLRLKYDDGIANFDSILKKIDSDNKKVEIENERIDNSFIKSIEFKNITIDNFTFYYNDKVVRGENKFTIKTPQILYKNKNFIFNSRIDFYNKGQVNFNLEYKKDGTLSGKLETKEFLLDDKLYIIKSLYNLKEIKGRVDSSFDFNFNFLKDIYNLEGQFNINQLKMNSVELGKLFSIDHLEGKIDSMKINENKFFLKEVKTNNGTVSIESIRKYMSSISKILNKKTNGNSEKVKKLSYPIFNIKALQISRYNIYDKDLNLEIDNLKVNDLGTLKGTSKVEFTGRFQNSKMTLTGEIEKEKNIKKEQNIDSIKIKGDLNIISFNLKGVSPFLQEGLELNGNLDVSSKFNYSINNLQIKNSVVLKKLSLKKDDFDLKFGILQFNNKFLRDSNNYKISGTIDAKNGSFNMLGIDLILKNGAIEIEEFSEDKIKLGVIKLQSPWIKMNSKESQNNLGKTKNKTKNKNRFDIIDYLINKLGIINFKNKFIENIEKANGNRQNNRNKLPVLSIKKMELSDGRLDYFHKDIKYNVRNIEIDIKKFTTANKNNFSGNLKADLTGDGKLKFTFFSSLEKKWNFSPTSLNMDGDIEVLKLNLLDFKKIILKNLPNEIDNGKLNYSSKFNLNKGKIVGSNLILIEKIKIGKATEKNSLVPLKLGVNILKDRNDNLKLEIPISGNFNNPKFNIYQVILEALKNILIKAVASPADFVLSSFDIGDEKDLFVEYEYLNLNFENKDNETLEKVAEILENKEPINIIFTLFTDKEIEKNLLNTKLKKEMLLKKDIKNEILEEKINKLIEERKEKIETYFRNKKLESRIKVQISDVSRDKPITSIEFVIKNLKEN